METSFLTSWSGAGVAATFGIIVLWLIVAGTMTLRGGGVEKPNRVPQLYGYTVCLVAVITLLFSASALIGSAIDLTNPLYAGFGFEPALSSFEAYQATYQRSEGRPLGPPDAARADSLSEETLRARWEGLRADRVARQTFAATRSIVTSAFLAAVSALLFVLHWRWLGRLKSLQTAG